MNNFQRPSGTVCLSDRASEPLRRSLARPFEDSATDTIIVDPSNPCSMDLFRQAYEEIYMQFFPVDKHGETLERMEDVLRNPTDKLQYVIVIAGKNLRNPEDRVIQAISVACYYPEQNAALMAYNGVSPGNRSGGLGRLMVQARIDAVQKRAAEEGKDLRCIAVEAHNPDKVDAGDDCIDPQTRLAIFQKLGARVIPIDYVMPPIAPGAEKSNDFLLMAYPVNGRYPSGTDMLCYIRGVYEEQLGPCYRSDPDFQRMRDQLESWPGFDAPRFPLVSKPAVKPAAAAIAA